MQGLLLVTYGGAVELDLEQVPLSGFSKQRTFRLAPRAIRKPRNEVISYNYTVDSKILTMRIPLHKGPCVLAVVF